MTAPQAPATSPYSDFAFGPAARIYAFLTRHEVWRESCRALGELVPGPVVLDLGIGPGTSALEMARADRSKLHLGLDRSGGMLRRAARGVRDEGILLPLVQADASALPVRSGSLDGATGHSLLYLLPDPAAALAELRRALRPGGRVAFLEPRAGGGSVRDSLAGGVRCAASMLLWRGMSRLHRSFDEAGLATLLSRAGFVSVRTWPAVRGFGVLGTAVQPG